MMHDHKPVIGNEPSSGGGTGAIQAWEAAMAACLGALVVSGSLGVSHALRQGKLQVIPQRRAIIAPDMRPIWVAFRVRNSGGGDIHLIGASGG